PSSFLHPPGPGCAVPGEHLPSASCTPAIPDRRPLFISDDPAEEAECGESTADGVDPLLGPVRARRKGEDPRPDGDVAWRPALGVESTIPGAHRGRAPPVAGVPEVTGRARVG